MSVRLMGRVFELQIGPTDKLVLLALADHARDDGTGAYPSVPTLARKTSFTDRCIRDVLRRLKAAGFITATGRSKHDTIEYSIILEKKEAWVPSDRVARSTAPPEPGSSPLLKLDAKTSEPGSSPLLNAGAKTPEPGSPNPSGTGGGTKSQTGLPLGFAVPRSDELEL